MRTCLLLAVAVLLLGCRLAGPWPVDEIPEIEYSRQAPWAVATWVTQYLTYEYDWNLYGVAEYWATPLESYGVGSGDCEDHAILALYLIERDLGLQGDLVIGVPVATPFWAHVWFRVGDEAFNGQVFDTIDPDTGRAPFEEEYLITEIMSWSEVKERIGI